MKIINREQIELNEAEREILIKVRLKKTIFLLSAYLAIVAVVVIAYMTGWVGKDYVSIEKMRRIRFATGILSLFFLVLLSIFFGVYYYRTVYPYTRDLKKGMKTISWFYPTGYKTPYFDKFFLKTGSRKKPMMSIPRELYDAIRPGVLACILFAPTSRFVLSLDIDGWRLEFNETNSDLEL